MTFDDLERIKGIGKETVADLERVYSTMDQLKQALKNDLVPLRNDIVKLLKQELL